MSSTVMELLANYGIPFVALVVCLGELGLPTGIPSEILLLLAGSYAVHSLPGLIVALAAVCLADIIGTTTLHAAARGHGARLLTRFLHRQPGESRFVAWGRRRFGGHDWIWIFLGRLIPIVRMPVTVSSGIIGVDLRHFLIGAIPASILWAGTPLAAGYFFRADVGRIEIRYAQFSRLLLTAAAVAAVAAAFAWWLCRGRPLPRVGGQAWPVPAAAVVALAILGWTFRGNERAAAAGVADLAADALVRHLAIGAVLVAILVGLLAMVRGRNAHAAAGAVTPDRSSWRGRGENA